MSTQINVKDALLDAEAALEVAIQRILKRDPIHAIHVTSEAKALVSVRQALSQCQGCAVQQGTHVPMGVVTEIKEPALRPERVENVIFRMEMEGDTQAAETVEAQLVKEAARTAEQKLRADQFEQRLDMANKLGNEAREQLAAAQQGVQPINSEALSTTQAVPTAVETLALSRECEKMPGGLGGFHHNYALEVLKRWGHPTPQGLDADMFWDAGDPERCETSINNVVVEVDSCRGLKVGDTVTIQRAKSLPDLEVRVTQVPDTEGNGDLEWAEIDAAQAKQGEQA